MLFAAQETPLFVLNDDEALFANERGRAEDASTRNITAHFKNNEEEEEEDRTRIEKKQQNDFSSGSGDIVRLRDGSLLSWRTTSGKNAVEIVLWREERDGERRENAASRAVKTIEITFPTDTKNELCAKSVVLAPTSVNDDGASLFRVIACSRTVQTNGKVLEMYVATVEESADKSSLRLKGGAVAKKAVKLETAGLGRLGDVRRIGERCGRTVADRVCRWYGRAKSRFRGRFIRRSAFGDCGWEPIDIVFLGCGYWEFVVGKVWD